MAIKIIGRGQRLSNISNASVYATPGDAISATIATGTVENASAATAKLFIRIGGRNTWIIKGKDIPVIVSPLVLPPITLNVNEWLEAWTDVNLALDINLTIGEQR